MAITSIGIGSGLDLEGIVEAYIDAEAIPSEIRLQEKEDRLTTELSGVSQFKSALSTFETTLEAMSDTDDFNQQLVDVSTDDITVETNGFASNGSFSIEVQQMAQGSRVQSAALTSSSDTVGTGTLTFTAGSDTFDVDIEATDTLSAIRDKVNAESENFGLTANIINTDAGSYLVYNSTITGDDNNLSVTSSGTGLTSIAELSTQGSDDIAQDAIIVVDGNTITQDSNEFKNIIEDVTITVNAENIGEPTTLTISQDEENGTTLLNNFVSAYNAMRTTLDSLGNAETGELAFDANVRQVKSQMSSIVSGVIDDLSSSYTGLYDIGLTIDSDGLMEISSVGIGTLDSGSEKLASALENNLSGVGEIFASENGVATQLLSLIDTYNGSDGTLSVRSSSLSVDISGIADEYTALEEKLRDYEDTLRNRFTALDQTVSTFNATSTWLTSTLSGLSGSSSS